MKKEEIESIIKSITEQEAYEMGKKGYDGVLEINRRIGIDRWKVKQIEKYMDAFDLNKNELAARLGIDTLQLDFCIHILKDYNATMQKFRESHKRRDHSFTVALGMTVITVFAVLQAMADARHWENPLLIALLVLAVIWVFYSAIRNQ